MVIVTIKALKDGYLLIHITFPISIVAKRLMVPGKRWWIVKFDQDMTLIQLMFVVESSY